VLQPVQASTILHIRHWQVKG